jgi:hypothetical protein
MIFYPYIYSVYGVANLLGDVGGLFSSIFVVGQGVVLLI